MNKFIAVIGLLTLLAGCASTKKAAEEAPTDEKVNEYDQGMRALEHEDYDEAAQIFDRLLVQKPATELDLVVLFDSGAAYEGKGDCARSLDRYRQVVRSSSGKFQRIEGEALFRSSLMYECLGQDAKAITSLVDAKKRGKELPFETLNAEIPARLAAAYARIGNREKALQYFGQASKGLKQVVAQGGRGLQVERIAHTLFLMGRLSSSQRKAEVEPGTYLQSVSMQQPYLLQAMEMNNVAWSTRAQDDLKLAYDNIWKFKIPDVEKRRDFYTRALQTINELRKIRMPKSDPRIEDVFVTLDRTQNQLQGELSRVAETNPLTPEAERRNGLKREGKLVDPEKPATKKKLIRK